MAIQDFYPFNDNQKVTAAMWNELLAAIQNGEFFLDTAPISTQLDSMATRIKALEIRMAQLEALQAWQKQREQLVLTQHQVVVRLSKTPRLDSEYVYLNGLAMSKTIPNVFAGDYTIDGTTITFAPEWQPQIAAGDTVVVVYEFGV